MNKTVPGIIVLAFFILLYFPSISASNTSSDSVKEGNRLFNSDKYDEALKSYNEALVNMPESPVVHFNMGAAYYKKEEYSKAEESFTKALTTDDQKLEARAAYNIGNSKYKQGKLKENTNLSEAISYYRQSLDYYKRAVELDENNRKAKFNHELVEKELKILMDRQKNQPPQEDKSQDENDEGKQCPLPPKPGEGEEKKEEPGESKDQKQEEQPSGAKEEEEQSAGKDEESEEEKAGGMEEKENGMTEEEAEMILDSHDMEEMPLGQIQQDGRRGRAPQVLKDW